MSDMIKHFRDLEVYRKAQALYPEIISFVKDFPREGFSLRDQLARSANGIQANIAEGFGRSPAEFKMYLTRALGSCNETISHINDALNVGFGDKEKGRMLLREYEIVARQIFRLRENWK